MEPVKISVKFLLAFFLCAAAILTAPADGALADQSELLYPDESVKARVHLRKGEKGLPVRHGLFERFHPNGERALLGFYHKSKAVGIWTWWDEEGRPIRKVRMDGEFEEVLYGGEFTKNEITFKNTAGTKLAEGMLKFDKGHGKWVYWYRDGTPRAQGNFVAGRPDGRWVLLYPDGQFRGIVEYKLGIMHGLYMRSYPTGLEEEEGRMEHGLREGLWRFWYNDGQIKKEGEYRRDLLEGEWKFWEPDGTLTQILRFDAGLLVGERYPPRKKVHTPVIPNADRFIDRPRLFDEGGTEIIYQEK